jgi:hypothetical protein
MVVVFAVSVGPQAILLVVICMSRYSLISMNLLNVACGRLCSWVVLRHIYIVCQFAVPKDTGARSKWILTGATAVSGHPCTISEKDFNSKTLRKRSGSDLTSREEISGRPRDELVEMSPKVLWIAEDK